MTADQLASIIDHTLLKPDATPPQIKALCLEGLEFGFASVCVNPVFVPQAADVLKGSRVRVCTVAGFPLGASRSEIKVAEAERAIVQGASEIDMVLWVGGLKSGDHQAVEADVASVARVCSAAGALLKVILETALLTEDEIRTACRICVAANANFVKTSTGFSGGGATADAVRIMAWEVAEAGLGVKASGGIRTWGDAQTMVEAGATRIGASASLKILEEARAAGH